MSKSSLVEKLAGLRRKLEVVVPAEKVVQAYDERLKKVARSAKIDGFRPGKIPEKVIEQRFGQNVLFEIAQELMQQYFSLAVEEHELKIVSIPELTPQNIKRGEALQYSVEFEVYPDIQLPDLSQVQIERQIIELQDQDIVNMLKMLAKQQAEWVEVERLAQTGDRVVMDFAGTIDGELFENGSAKNFQLELGSGQMIPGFEDSLLGIKAGEERDIKCTFPAEYHHQDLAGKEATFKITVHKVQEPKLPEINDEFAGKTGLDTLDELKQEIEKSMKKQVAQLMHDRVKQKVMEKLLELNTIEIPEALIDAEIEHLQQLALQQLSEQAKNVDAANLFPREHFEKQARRRVTLGLLLGEVIKQHELKVEPQKVRERVEQIAAVYHKPEEVMVWYYSNKRMLAEVESVVLEDQAVDKLLGQMQVTDEKISYEEATKRSQNREAKDTDTQ
ncbi:MAG: trigger factor [Coxiella sp. RIFCSPHIGHO2_12_FULL_44_14]|nr:MAG: trigger factor [Coxiella sp. RIFCSPHIGHO2_12_FULL_44_14]